MKETKKTGVELDSVSRRKAVKKIVGGLSALAAYHTLPVNWSKPIIEQVFLPAHAQTSGCPGCSLNDPCTITITSGNSTSSQVVVQVVGRLDQPIAGLPATITVTPQGAGIAPPVLSTVTDAEGKFTGTFTITGGPGITAVSAITKVEGVDPAGCDIRITTPTQEPAPEPTQEPAPECENIPFRVVNNSNMNTNNATVTITYDTCTENGLVYTLPADESHNFQGVHPSRNVTIIADAFVTIDDGDGPENLDEDTPRVINPAEHPVVTIDDQPN